MHYSGILDFKKIQSNLQLLMGFMVSFYIILSNFVVSLRQVELLWRNDDFKIKKN